MNNTIITIIKKELARFFGDRRMLLSTILLPGLMIYVIYSFMGDALKTQVSSSDNNNISCYVQNLPENLQKPFQKMKCSITNITSEKEIDKAKDKVKNKKCDLCILFPENFTNEIQSYDVKSGKKAPNIIVYYNSANSESDQSYKQISEFFNQYEASMTNKFDINENINQIDDDKYDLASKEDEIASMFASMLPMLLLVFLYSGTLAVAPESIAGEKERGTIATLLVTPVKRSSIAIGKIIALSIIAVISALSSTIGTVLSLPKMMMLSSSSSVTENVYGIKDYAILGVIILSTVMILVTILSLISTFAKTIKEAQTFATPLMVLVMLVGITAMFGSDAKSDIYYYCIPLYNSVQSMVSIFKFAIVPSNILVTIGINFIVTIVGIFGLTKLFHSEKIMFSK